MEPQIRRFWHQEIVSFILVASYTLKQSIAISQIVSRHSRGLVVTAPLFLIGLFFPSCLLEHRLTFQDKAMWPTYQTGAVHMVSAMLKTTTSRLS